MQRHMNKCAQEESEGPQGASRESRGEWILFHLKEQPQGALTNTVHLKVCRTATLKPIQVQL